MIVSQQHLEQALHILEERAQASGWQPDRVNLPPGCNKLCDLLGVMWYSGETQAKVPDDGPTAQRLREVFGSDFAGLQAPAPAP